MSARGRSPCRCCAPWATRGLHSVERREDFAEIARVNVEGFFGGPHPAWQLTVGDLVGRPRRRAGSVDRVVLDMLAPWECLDAVAAALAPGGLFISYVATTTQLSRVAEEIRDHGGYTEPEWESLVRGWHLEGLAVRPQHRMIGHTGFLLTTRRLADGVDAPQRRRRPAKGAYPAWRLGRRPGRGRRRAVGVARGDGGAAGVRQEAAPGARRDVGQGAGRPPVARPHPPRPELD